jgi:FkbM family methyltransferase
VNIQNIIIDLFSNKSPLFFEIGANDGTDTVWLSQIAKVVHAFEPDDEVFSKLALVKFQNQVILNHCAIGKKVGIVQFYKSSGIWPAQPVVSPLGDRSANYCWDKSGSIKKPKEHLITHPWCKFDSTIQVRVETLDNYCTRNKIDKIDFMWADVQGAEADMIAGGKDTFSKRVEYLYTEYSNSEQYEGQSTLDEIKALLSDYKIIQKFEPPGGSAGDVLFHNENFK